MIKYIFFILFFAYIVSYSQAQIINVIDNTTNFPVGYVKIYGDSQSDTLYTNEDGAVDISVFTENAVIYFDHDFFKLAFYTKEELIRKNVVKLSRGDALKQENRSPLAVEEYSKDLPFYVDIVDLKENSVFQNTSEDIGVSQKVMYEKNQEGGNSVFRGLEANKVLLVMDGVRLNNVIYRYGRIQNAINFEGTLLERSQQIYGSSFLIYSTDASGGVINYFTKQPLFAAEDEKIKSKINFTNQYATATETWSTNFNFNIGLKKVATFTGLTYNDYGRIQIGRNRSDKVSADYGLHKYYVATVNGKDIMYQNPNPTKLMNTNYQRFNFVNKFSFYISENISLHTNFHYSNSSATDIYSGITEVNGNNNRFAICEYRPAANTLFSVNTVFKKATNFYTYFSILTSFQNIKEYRVTRKFNNLKELHQLENLKVYSINFDFIKLVKIHRLMYGVEIVRNDLNSEAFFREIRTNDTTPGLNRYPTYGTYANNYATYFNFKWLLHPQFILNLGGRYEYIYAYSEFSNLAPQLKLDFTQVRYNHSSPSVGISFDAYPVSGMMLSFITSTAYHVPIADEYGKVMVKDFVITVPNNELQPEKTLNFEMSVNQKIIKYLNLNVTAFNTWLMDAIVLSEHTLDGKDSIYFGTDGYKIATQKNINMARVYGISSSLNYSHYFLESDKRYIKFKSSVNYIIGQNIEEKISLPNISPVFGQTSIIFAWDKFSANCSHIYNGQKKYDELSSLGQDYIEKADINGFMAWQTFNISMAYSFFNRISTQLTVNNMLDTFYRSYASSISAPGRNFIFTLKINL